MTKDDACPASSVSFTELDGRARPKKRAGCKPIRFVLLYCIIAMNIVVPVTTELSLLQRRGGARKPINALSQSDWCD